MSENAVYTRLAQLAALSGLVAFLGFGYTLYQDAKAQSKERQKALLSYCDDVSQVVSSLTTATNSMINYLIAQKLKFQELPSHVFPYDDFIQTKISPLENEFERWDNALDRAPLVQGGSELIDVYYSDFKDGLGYEFEIELESVDAPAHDPIHLKYSKNNIVQLERNISSLEKSSSEILNGKRKMLIHCASILGTK